MTPEIIYHDSDMIVVNKPPGISVHGGPAVRGATLVDFLVEEFPEIKNVGDAPKTRPGIVHRLDKDTSGIMVVARNQKTFEALKRQFQDRLVEKTYRAIVCGALKEKSGTITFAIGRLVKNPAKRGIEIKQGMIKNSREAITGYTVLRGGTKYSLMKLKPKTGRTHQLRIHMKALGHPVACDTMYGGKNVCCPDGATRQLLHAQSLSFSPAHGKRFFFEADPPPDYTIALKNAF
jgi:23S rRNA pseudouridine1911/1915/1917 synthase